MVTKIVFLILKLFFTRNYSDVNSLIAQKNTTAPYTIMMFVHVL